jgi:hypothetical protein
MIAAACASSGCAEIVRAVDRFIRECKGADSGRK